MTPTSWAPYVRTRHGRAERHIARDPIQRAKHRLRKGWSLSKAAVSAGMSRAELDLALWNSLGVKP